MERFSKRRKQIEEAAAAFIAEHGRKPTLAENNAISNSTRSAKMQTSTRETVRDLQLKQLSEDELAQLISLVKPGAVIEAMDREQCRDVIRETMAELFERESVVSQDKLLAEVLNYSLGSFELNDLKNVLQEIPELKNLGGEEVNPFYSPQEVIEREQNSIESVEDQQGIFEPLAPDFVPFEGNDSRREQADFIRGLLASPDCFNLFRGVAGAGKTSTLQEFCKGLKSANVENIVVVAPTNSATDVLKQEGFEQSQTVASSLFSVEKPPEKSYIIIDEAGLNSLREGYEILTNYIVNQQLCATYRKQDADPYGTYPGKKISQLKHLSKTGLHWDALPTNTTPYRGTTNTITVTNATYNCVGRPHGGKKVANLLYADGHAVSTIPAPYLPVVFSAGSVLREGSEPNFQYCN